MKLVIVNGPCGVGKSALAAQLHARMPGSFLLDIDAQRRFISGYREAKAESARFSHELALGILRMCFEAERGVVLDKYLFDPVRIDAFRRTAQEYGAEVHELLLWATKETVMRRAEGRGWREGGMLTPEKCASFWDRIDTLRGSRREAAVIDTTTLDTEATLKAALRAIEGDAA